MLAAVRRSELPECASSRCESAEAAARRSELLESAPSGADRQKRQRGCPGGCRPIHDRPVAGFVDSVVGSVYCVLCP